MTVRLLDLVGEQHPTLFPRKLDSKGRVINTSKVVKGRTVVRDPKVIDSVVLHQTACVFGPLNDQDKRHRRALKIPAHVTAFRDGVYVQAAPLLWFLYHANDYNATALGLECEGQYPGLRDDPKTPQREDEETFWAAGAGKPTPLDELSIETFRAALTHLVVAGRELGCPIKYVKAHRQTSKTRRSDPGEGIWTEVALWAEEHLNVSTLPLETRRDGRPIPIAWDPARGRGRY